jgi:IPT/TIG domain-containing protein
MAVRPWWSRKGVVGVGVILAAALGAWQAARVADALGFGPGLLGLGSTRTPVEGPRRGGSGAPRPEGRAGEGAAPTRGIPASSASRTASDPGSSDGAPWSVSTAAPGAAGPSDEAESEAAERLSGEMRRFIQDLEFTPGLPEPRQQTVVPPPAPWRPPDAAAARPPPVITDVTPRRAPAAGGTPVVIRGRNLGGVRVMFGAAVARVTAAGEEAVTVLAPPGTAGQVAVAVTSADGGWAVASQPFTYLR